MESGNSGSFQSSTGDEEYDSHGDGISAVIMNNQQKQPPPPPPPCNTVSSSYMYDHHRQPLQQPPPPPQPLENNYQRSFMNSSSYVLDWSQRSELNNMYYRHGSAPAASQPPSTAENNTRIAVSVLQQPSPPPPPPPPTQESRKPRKRSRASRGAATTVLTTDTTNFRAMVQEFTGIPEPPFQKNRLDIFGTVSGITSPPYLRRPFPQKLNPPFSSFSSFSSSNTINATTNNNYHFTPQSSSFLNNLQNQFIPSLTHQESRVFSLNDEGFNTTNMLNPSSTGFLGLISSDQRTSTNDGINQASTRSWRNGTGSNQEDDDQTHTNFTFSSSS